MTHELLIPVLTNVGLSTIISAQQQGFNAKISHVAVGDGDQGSGPQGYVPDKTMVQLRNELNRTAISGGGQLMGKDQTQLHLTAVINDLVGEGEGETPTSDYSIYEIGFFLSSGELFAIYSVENVKIAEKVLGTDFVMMYDLTVSGAASENIVIDGSATLPQPLAKDNLLWGSNTVKIHTQQEFDSLFNSGKNEAMTIAENMTIILSPIQGAFEYKDSGQWKKMVAGKAEGNGFAITGFSQSDINPNSDTKVYSPAHGLNEGDQIVITNSHYYSHTFAVTNSSTDTFDIVILYQQGNLANGAWGGVGDNPHHTYNSRPAYILKNSLNLSSNTSIIGFNAHDTLVVKNQADIKINIIGSETQVISGVRLSGWSFDGRGNVKGLGGHFDGTNDGGAFYLEYAENCQLNCHIINHKTTANGGGIYCVSGTSKYITANYIISNAATLGSGAYGGTDLNYHFINCQGSELNRGISSIDHHKIIIEGDLKVTDLTVSGSADLPAATESTKGMSRIATVQEVVDGTESYALVTPALLSQALTILSININGPQQISSTSNDNMYSIEVPNASTYEWFGEGFIITPDSGTANVSVTPDYGILSDRTLYVKVTTTDNQVINRSLNIQIQRQTHILNPTENTSNISEGSIQAWTVPAGVSMITIAAWGAQGGNNNWASGGLGAYIKGDILVESGSEIKIVVGERGGIYSAPQAGGGGGSFIWLEGESMPLIVAGGGGGGGKLSDGREHGVITKNGNSGQTLHPTYVAGAGGIDGEGGEEGRGSQSSYSVGGGAGWKSNGKGSFPGLANPDFSGGLGNGIDGGFGGGGGADTDGAAGGGGYSGGGGGSWAGDSEKNGAGGGGGSYFADNAQNVVGRGGIRTGRGQVIISW